jgi:sensor domain CHASE-containing protein
METKGKLAKKINIRLALFDLLVVMMFIFLSTTIALTIYYEVEKKNHLEIENSLINKIDSLNYEISKLKGETYFITPKI